MKIVVLLLLGICALFGDNGFLIQNKPFDTDKIVEKIDNAASLAVDMEAIVEAAAVEWGIDSALALSIAKVESNFNPNAVSSSNAIGLMQLKMDTAVKDIYESIYQKTVLPDSKTLFNPKENAKLGVAYLSLIQKKYLKDILDKEKLEYCTIAAYNTGAGAVLRTFHDDKTEAIKIINALPTDEVLRRLMFNMQSEQGRRYLLKVLDAKNRIKRVLLP